MVENFRFDTFINNVCCFLVLSFPRRYLSSTRLTLLCPGVCGHQTLEGQHRHYHSQALDMLTRLLRGFILSRGWIDTKSGGYFRIDLDGQWGLLNFSPVAMGQYKVED